MSHSIVHKLDTSAVLAVLAIIGGCMVSTGQAEQSVVSAKWIGTDGESLLLTSRHIGALEDLVIEIVVQNIGTRPVKVDQRLVFMVGIKCFNKDGKYINAKFTGKPINRIEASGGNQKDHWSQPNLWEERFIELLPEASLLRVINFSKGYAEFYTAIGSFSEGSYSYHRIDAGEIMMQIENPQSISSVEITYGKRPNISGFHEYTKMNLRDVLTNSRSLATIVLKVDGREKGEKGDRYDIGKIGKGQ